MPPTGAQSNIRKWLPRAFSRNDEIMIFGRTPTKVAIPAKIVAKLRGIRGRAAAGFAFLEVCTPTGSNNAKAATVFINEDTTAQIIPIKPMCMDKDWDTSIKFFVIR